MNNLTKSICSTLNISTKLGKRATKIALKNLLVLDRKNQDYGSEGLKRHGDFGVLIRLGDKLSRLDNLYKQRNNPNDEELIETFESIDDSWLDSANYALIGQTLREIGSQKSEI